ncbi:response regulator [Paenibacillus cisolokensis]|uniref:response regulator n=1 Tax=Paenibacillus TaxID=44249 RepID=UPI00071F73AE|nr:response regulator [Paenibacillus sp. 32O-W]ALS29535.1 two-component system response regulator [Paenibacillus sp. 32O-W]
MNLMIVEDEPRLRSALAHNMPWEEHGIEVVGAVPNGREALKLAERKRVDIALVDIQMPEMDGLALIGNLRRQQDRSRMKIIILSGHDNFEYARNGIEFGVMKYLLKPAGEEDILSAVLSAANELREDMKQWQTGAELRQKWTEHLPHLQNSFFQHWVGGKYARWEVLARGADVQVDVTDGTQAAAAVVDIDPVPEDSPRFGSGDIPLLQFSLLCLAKELLTRPGCWVCGDAQGRVLLVFLFEPGDDPNDAMLRIHDAVDKLLFHTKEVLKLTASAGICSGTGDIGDLHLLYEQACRALQERIVYGQGIAIPYREQERRERRVRIGSGGEQTLAIALETADEQKALEALIVLWNEGYDRAETSDEALESVLHLQSLFVRIIQKQGWMVKDVVRDDIVYFQNVKLLGSKDQTWSLLVRTVRHICDYMQSQRKKTSHQVVKQILNIVERELDQEMTLHTVADRLYVNPSYLSRLFKQEMGVPFSAYVLERKMERAKAALLEGGKVYDAARRTGYRDVSYFTKVFRKYWGVTPGEMKP